MMGTHACRRPATQQQASVTYLCQTAVLAMMTASAMEQKAASRVRASAAKTLTVPTLRMAVYKTYAIRKQARVIYKKQMALAAKMETNAPQTTPALPANVFRVAKLYVSKNHALVQSPVNRVKGVSLPGCLWAHNAMIATHAP